MAPVVKELARRKSNFFIIHTGQHYSYSMDRVFFEQLELPDPKYNLEAGSGLHGEQTGKMLAGIEKVLLEEKPDIILIEGDTNTVLAAALAAAKLHIRIGHVEAGLRSYDRDMPEEVNRVLTDHCSDYLFAPTERARSNLLAEGIAPGKVSLTGNTIVDALMDNIKRASNKTDALGRLRLRPQGYVLVTVHRQENVDSASRFSGILEGIRRVACECDVPVVYPVHPRSRLRMRELHLAYDGITLTEPADFFSFLQLESNARLVITDSGGVQEESCILNVPCVTVRDNTERPETVDVGANVLAGTAPDSIFNCSRTMMTRKANWKQPFGDGRAAERIVDIARNANR